MLAIPNQRFAFDSIDTVTVLSPLWETSYSGPIARMLAQVSDRDRPPLKHRTPEFRES
jgi:hypothetical protein